MNADCLSKAVVCPLRTGSSKYSLHWQKGPFPLSERKMCFAMLGHPNRPQKSATPTKHRGLSPDDSILCIVANVISGRYQTKHMCKSWASPPFLLFWWRTAATPRTPQFIIKGRTGAASCPANHRQRFAFEPPPQGWTTFRLFSSAAKHQKRTVDCPEVLCPCSCPSWIAENLLHLSYSTVFCHDFPGTHILDDHIQHSG